MKLSTTEVALYLGAVLIFATAHVLWDAPFLLLYVSVGVAGVSSLILRRRSAPKEEKQKYVSPYAVAFDEREVVVSVAGTKRESVFWDDLVVVGVRIESQGFLDMPYWVLGGRSAGCMYPNDAVGSELLLNELQVRLPGFDNQAVIQAMGMIGEGVVVWKRTESDVPDTSAPLAPTSTVLSKKGPVGIGG
jgi:hypothetical protein